MKSFIFKLEGSDEIKRENFQIELQGIKNQKTSKTWKWSIELEKYGKKYSFSANKSTILDSAKTIAKIPNIEISMSLANTGEMSTYTFKVPRLDGLNESINDFYV